MKRLIPLIIFAAAVSMAGWSPQQLQWLRVAHEPTFAFPLDGLLLYYAMEDDADNTHVDDSHENNYHGTANKNTDQLSTEGKIGKAFALDGVNDNVNAGDYAAYDVAGPFSVTAWAKTSRDWNPDNQQYVSLVVKHTIYVRGFGVSVYERSPDGGEVRLQFWVRSASGMENVFVDVKNTWDKDTWYHIAGVYDGIDLHLYLDGEFLSSDTGLDPGHVDGDILWIGSSSDSREKKWPGKVDEAGIWNRALTSNEVYRLFSEELTYP